jgi:hypothetical protein
MFSAGQHEVIAENLSTAVVSDLSSLVKSLKDDRRKVIIDFISIVSYTVQRVWVWKKNCLHFMQTCVLTDARTLSIIADSRFQIFIF